MNIRWLGHSSFYIETDGHTIITDPYEAAIGYPVKFPSADIVTVSHEHSDHNAVQRVGGKPIIIRESVDKVIDGIRFKGVGGAHDDDGGLKRGLITMFRIESEGISIVHLGDLGTLLSKEQIDQLLPVNILLVPVGGYFTIDAAKAHKVIESLHPNIAIPMHYKTEYLRFDIAGVEPFLKDTQYVKKDSLDVTSNTLPEPTTIVLLKLHLSI
ncbi:MAG: MBL fold metallo-hydrolase [Caldisericaceae bacterium]